ncbi:unnamed protein product [Spirodela intermedia]|nr:unnamed protein product [Spirodela intermedia]CAA6668974.1 unnamed protein product [Spirodela intermedia]
MARRFFSPPLIPRRCQLPMGRSAHSTRPISSSVLSTTVVTSFPGTRSRAEYATVSRTVSVPRNVFSCVTYA